MIRDEDVQFGDLFLWHAGGVYMFLGWPEDNTHWEDGRSWTALIVENSRQPKWAPVIQWLTVGFQCRVDGHDGWERVE